MKKNEKAFTQYQNYSLKLPNVRDYRDTLDPADTKGVQEYMDQRSRYSLMYHFHEQNNWGKAVDFGGRIGEGSRGLKDITVVEIDQSAIDWMKSRHIPCAKSLETFPNHSLDLIYCSHVLEHLEDPMKYLRLFHQKLKTGGRVIIVLPEEGQVAERGAGFPPADLHLQMWNLGHLSNSLQRAGFEMTEWENITLCYTIFIKKIFGLGGYYRFLSLHYKLTRSRAARNLLFVLYWQLVKPITHFVAKLHPVDMGVEMRVLAVKK